MKHAMLSLDYFALAKEAKALKTGEAGKVVRIALLATARRSVWQVLCAVSPPEITYG